PGVTGAVHTGRRERAGAVARDGQPAVRGVAGWPTAGGEDVLLHADQVARTDPRPDRRQPRDHFRRHDGAAVLTARRAREGTRTVRRRPRRAPRRALRGTRSMTDELPKG